MSAINRKSLMPHRNSWKEFLAKTRTHVGWFTASLAFHSARRSSWSSFSRSQSKKRFYCVYTRFTPTTAEINKEERKLRALADSSSGEACGEAFYRSYRSRCNAAYPRSGGLNYPQVPVNSSYTGH